MPLTDLEEKDSYYIYNTRTRFTQQTAHANLFRLAHRMQATCMCCMACSPMKHMYLCTTTDAAQHVLRRFLATLLCNGMFPHPPSTLYKCRRHNKQLHSLGVSSKTEYYLLSHKQMPCPFLQDQVQDTTPLVFNSMCPRP